MGFENSYKKVKAKKTGYVNMETGELLDSEQPGITSHNVVDPNYCIVTSKEYAMIDKNTLRYLKSILPAKDIYYIYEMSLMTKGEFNQLHQEDDTLHDKKSLSEDFQLAKTRFNKLLRSLYDKSIIGYFKAVKNGKTITSIVLNPTIARSNRRFSQDLRDRFDDFEKLTSKPQTFAELQYNIEGTRKPKLD